MLRKAHVDIESLYRMYYRPLCLYALHYLNDSSRVEDVVQECFFSLFRTECAGEGASRNISSPKSYLYMMVRNRCLDILRKEARHSDSERISEVHEDIPEDELQEVSSMEARMWTAIDSLPPKCREVFLMGQRDGMSYEEISESLGISENTVRNQMSKALRIVREGVRKVVAYIFL